MNPEREIKKILEEFLRKEENIVLSEKIFVAVSVLNWAYLKYKDQHVLQHYLELVKKHLRGEIQLYWEKGVVKTKRGN